jgi:hypothetical protein
MNMKKTVIFIVVLGLVITFLTATPARAHWSFFWPGFAVGIGTAVIAVDPFFYPTGYYYPAPPVVYGGGCAYYGGPVYYGGGYRYYGGHYRGYHGGPCGGGYHGR